LPLFIENDNSISYYDILFYTQRQAGSTFRELELTWIYTYVYIYIPGSVLCHLLYQKYTIGQQGSIEKVQRVGFELTTKILKLIC